MKKLKDKDIRRVTIKVWCDIKYEISKQVYNKIDGWVVYSTEQSVKYIVFENLWQVMSRGTV
jgi:hypothetical protein